MEEHSFQVLMPNSPLLLKYLCFGARFSQESRLTTEGLILAFWLRCVLLPWQRNWLKTWLAFLPMFIFLNKKISLDLEVVEEDSVKTWLPVPSCIFLANQRGDWKLAMSSVKNTDIFLHRLHYGGHGEIFIVFWPRMVSLWI